jgi:membrane fusion protein (multidrug efflux system)
MFARVRLITRESKEALAVPEQALVPQGDQQFVYRIVDDKAVRTKVEVGQRRDARVEVLNGITRDDVIVTAGQLKLRDGASVKVNGGKEAATVAAPAVGLGSAASALKPADAPAAKAVTVPPPARKS